MSDKDLHQLFDQMDIRPSPEAQKRARQAALEAFDEAVADAGSSGVKKNSQTTQGLQAEHRPTADDHSNGSNPMNTTSLETHPTLKPQPAEAANQPYGPRWLYGGMASAAVLLLGVFVAFQGPPLGNNLPQLAPAEPTVSRAAELDDKAASALAEAKTTTAKTTTAKTTTAKTTTAATDAPLNQKAAAINAPPPYPAAVSTLREKHELQEVLVMADRADSSLQSSAPTFSQAKLAPKRLSLAESVAPHPPQPQASDRFEQTSPNAISRASDSPVSTFSIDVDTSSYSFVRRQLNQGLLPSKAAVRLEEMVNYFPYDYPLPQSMEQPFSQHVTIMDSPWNAANKLLHIGIQGYEMVGQQPPSNLVFLLDVSGSMNSPDKLPLVKQSMQLLLSRMQPEDTVAIVVYAGAAGTVLEPTPVKEKQTILNALKRLNAGGSTAGAAGIQLAYQLAEANFLEEGVNRIVLATDGDFNVGINNLEELKGFVERKRESGVYLSVLGFGQGNYNDQLMQTLAQNGNGVAAYIDSLSEAQKVLVDEATSALFPIAKDVKIQVEFNPATVSEYRLLGYETRQLANEDFKNDRVDAGDIGAGHQVTAIYEITPVGEEGMLADSRYQQQTPNREMGGKAREYAFLKLRYKLPSESHSRLVEQAILAQPQPQRALLSEARFASAVAGFAQLLQGGKYTGDWGYEELLTLAQANRGEDEYGYRAEFIQLIRKADLASSLSE